MRDAQVWSSLAAGAGVWAILASCCAVYYARLAAPNRALQERIRKMASANLDASARAFRAEMRCAALRRRLVVPSNVALKLSAWNDEEAATAVCDLWLTTPPDGEGAE